MSNSRTRIGIALIATGSILLAATLFLFLWQNILLPDGEAWFSGKRKEATLSGPERARIEAPMPTGSSELADYYARTPRNRKILKEEEPLDSSLWETDYYTSPEGQSWKKDSNVQNVLSETKKGEQVFTAPPSAVPDSAYAQEPVSGKPLHVEFWDSPVNYKGYKLDRNNLIVFGINPSDTLRFERHTDGVWMYHRQKIFLLKPSMDFMPFEERLPDNGTVAIDSLRQNHRNDSLTASPLR